MSKKKKVWLLLYVPKSTSSFLSHTYMIYPVSAMLLKASTTILETKCRDPPLPDNPSDREQGTAATLAWHSTKYYCAAADDNHSRDRFLISEASTRSARSRPRHPNLNPQGLPTATTCPAVRFGTIRPCTRRAVAVSSISSWKPPRRSRSSRAHGRTEPRHGRTRVQDGESTYVYVPASRY